jgi:PAS domain S-box-containing protein
LKSRRVTIRTSLFGLVAVCLIPAIVMAGGFVYQGYVNGRTKLVRESLGTARALMAAVDAEFASAETSMYALSTATSLVEGNFAAFHKRGTEVLRRRHANNIVLIDASGQQLLNTAVPYGQPLPKASNRAQLEYVLTSGKSSVSDMFKGPLLKRPIINIAVPVLIGNKPTYSLVAVILPDQIQEILIRQRFPPDRIVAIFDGTGTIVAFTGDVAKFRGQPLNPGLSRALLQAADEGSLETVNSLGVEVLTTYARSPTSRWGVAIGIPRAGLVAELSHTVWLLLGFGSLLLLASGGLAYFIGERITRAIRDLRAPARELGYGNPVLVPELPLGEADEVGQGISRASVMLANARESMIASEARMRAIVDSATDAIVIVDDSWNIVLFNMAAVTMFACPLEKAIGSSFLRFIPERLRVDFSARLQVSGASEFDSKGVAAIEVTTAKRKNGAEFPVELSFPRILDGIDKVHTLVLRDITRRLEIQAALERSNLDLQQFAFVASHDLKTPLRSIGGFLQLLKRNHAEMLDDKARMLVQRTLDATLRLNQLTDDLLSYARLGSELKPMALLDCTEAATDAIALLHGAIEDKHAVVTVDQLPNILGDRTQLVQLFLNLIGNGIKYCSGHAPVIKVSASPNEREWVFAVADNGIGIDARHHDKIFEVFKRLHNQTEYAGTGIGLAVCRRVVERHGGTIWVVSSFGKGSTFFFTIPHSHSVSESVIQ